MTRCLVAHFLCIKIMSGCLKMVRDKFYVAWIHTQGHITQLRRKTVRSIFYPAYNRHLFEIFRPGEDQIIPEAVIFVSDNF